MTKVPSPLLGYNNNVRHKNRVFHIQTEDSGVNHPHVITHLFMDGGRILKSVKRSYAEHVGTDALATTVRQIMKEQHKAMFMALRGGQFDALVGPPAARKNASAPPPAGPAAEAPEPHAVNSPDEVAALAEAAGTYSSVDPPESRGASSLPPKAEPEEHMRYGSTRPAAIFASIAPAAALFGDELVSDRSLDEVILNYLAEDLASPPRE